MFFFCIFYGWEGNPAVRFRPQGLITVIRRV